MSGIFKHLAIIGVTILVVCLGLYKYVIEPSSPRIMPRPGFSTPSSIINNLETMHSFSSGPLNAKVTVVEFFDPECEACASVAPYIKKEMEFYKGKVRWVFRYMPYHKNSKTAIRAIEAAKRQNLFLEVQNALFENQKAWGEKQDSAEIQILEIAAKVKSIKMDQLKADMNDPMIEEIIKADVADAKKAGVNGTPTFFVNGEILEQLNMDELIRRINSRL